MTTVPVPALERKAMNHEPSKILSSSSRLCPAVSGTIRKTYTRAMKHHPAKKMNAPQLSILERMEGVPLLTPK